MTANLSVPILRVQAPYIERKSIQLQVRTGLLAALAALLVCAGLALAWVFVPIAASETKDVVVKFAAHKPTTAGWQYPRATRSYDSMYAPGAETRSVDSMYAKPRSRRFDR